MASSVQELSGLSKALDRLEQRMRAHRKWLFAMANDVDPSIDSDRVTVTTAEVETIEALVRRIAIRISGDSPNAAEWSSMAEYCSTYEARTTIQQQKGGYAQQYEYIRWALLWLEKTRTYVRYLEGLQVAQGEPRSKQSDTTHVGIE